MRVKWQQQRKQSHSFNIMVGDVVVQYVYVSVIVYSLIV